MAADPPKGSIPPSERLTYDDVDRETLEGTLQYTITRGQLVRLFALEAEYATLLERGGGNWYTDQLLEISSALLTEIGVTDLEALNEEVGLELERGHSGQWERKS
jgi:hypothetical protein